MPERGNKELRQFICRGCPGKYSYHKYRVWHGWVDSNYLKSRCHNCNKMKEAVPRGEEEGVHVCNFHCPCGNEYVVRCEMRDTACCYACRARGRVRQVAPHSFQPLRKIKKKTDNVHSCSKCNGSGDCPNMRRQPKHDY